LIIKHFSIPIIGFLGRILGGIAVNIVPYLLQKRDEKKYEILKMKIISKVAKMLDEHDTRIRRVIICIYKFFFAVSFCSLFSLRPTDSLIYYRVNRSHKKAKNIHKKEFLITKN